MTPESLSRAAASDLLGERRVEEYATIGIHSVDAEAPLEEVAWLMSTNRVHAIVVADSGLDSPPVIADSDLVGATTSGKFTSLRARDVAASEPVSVDQGESLARAAQLLAEHGVSHLIVRDQRGYPVGILSSLDIARALATALSD